MLPVYRLVGLALSGPSLLLNGKKQELKEQSTRTADRRGTDLNKLLSIILAESNTYKRLLGDEEFVTVYEKYKRNKSKRSVDVDLL